MNKIIVFLLMMVTILSCDPQSEKDITLGPLPASPDFAIAFVPNDSNRVVVTDVSTDNFSRLWITGGNPTTSKLQSDTIYFPKKGEYSITLNISQTGGNGTASNTKKVIITKDAQTPCSGAVGLLTGECGPGGKCWKFSQVGGAITVGPTYGSGEWFKSPAGGLVPSQYDDRYCFTFDGSNFDYKNQGMTVNPFNGYVDEPFTPLTGPYTFSAGTGQNGADQIILNKGQFMGTRDSYFELDIVKLTETELIIRAPFAKANGDKADGWFEFKFVAE